MSRIFIALLGLLAYKAFKGDSTQAPNSEPKESEPSATPVAVRNAEDAAELEAKVPGLGGQPAQGGSVSGSMHRAWTNIKSTITGMNEHAVLAECERGEDTG